MRNLIYDYDKNSFYITTDSVGKKHYKLKLNKDYITVSKEVYDVCKKSYNKMRYDSKIKVDRSIISYEDIDQSAFFVIDKKININIVNHIYLKDLAIRIKKEISSLPKRDREIATCIFLEELSDRETSRFLSIPQTTVTYRKK